MFKAVPGGRFLGMDLGELRSPTAHRGSRAAKQHRHRTCRGKRGVRTPRAHSGPLSACPSHTRGDLGNYLGQPWWKRQSWSHLSRTEPSTLGELQSLGTPQGGPAPAQAILGEDSQPFTSSETLVPMEQMDNDVMGSPGQALAPLHS